MYSPIPREHKYITYIVYTAGMLRREKTRMRTALTIAGSDSSGGAGIQADIKTMMANGVFAMSAITALTAQNTTGVEAILNATPEFLGQELDCIFTDIYPDAVKIGMVSDKELICETYHCAGLCKGGHKLNDANDLLWSEGKGRWFSGKRIDNPNTHGTGCTLSSAIASNLAKGFDLETSVERAKDYISGALAAMLDLGKGSGPMDHGFAIDNEYTREAK